MGLTKKVIGFTTGLIIATGLVGAMNYIANHNIKEIRTKGGYFRKIDGITSYTSIDENSDRTAIHRNNMIRGIFIAYYDYDGDKLVDSINIQNCFVEYLNLNRKEHQKHYPQTFKNADRDFREQIKRFKPMMNR